MKDPKTWLWELKNKPKLFHKKSFSQKAAFFTSAAKKLLVCSMSIFNAHLLEELSCTQQSQIALTFPSPQIVDRDNKTILKIAQNLYCTDDTYLS